MDPVALTQLLVRCESVTPNGAGCLDLIQGYLEEWGFTCHRLPFEDVDNLYARLGEESPNLCFAGHVDVVPPGDSAPWRFPPFSAKIDEGRLYGRGVVDMKGAIGAFLAATYEAIQTPLPGSLSFLLTSDEEGVALNGTRRVVEWLKERGEQIDACLVGEPTNTAHIGDTVKIGRRGSLNLQITAYGKAGHAAYPELADNPVPAFLKFLNALSEKKWDEGVEGFCPSALQVTSIDVGNPTTNVIPEKITANINIRFNPVHTGESLIAEINKIASSFLTTVKITSRISGEAFHHPHPSLQTLLEQAIQKHTNRTPQFTTGGGTSDARFIKDICPVIEFGLTNQTAHQTDENSDILAIHLLSKIYLEVIRGFERI